MNKMNMERRKGPNDHGHDDDDDDDKMLKNIFLLFYYHNTCSRIDNAECLLMMIPNGCQWMIKMLHFHLYQFVKREWCCSFSLISIWQNGNPFQFHIFFCLFYMKSMPNFVCTVGNANRAKEMAWIWSERRGKNTKQCLKKGKRKCFDINAPATAAYDAQLLLYEFNVT